MSSSTYRRRHQWSNTSPSSEQSLDDLVGRSLQTIKHWDESNLHYKVVAEINEEKSIGCQLGYIACEDGAHLAIRISGNGIAYHRSLKKTV